MEWFARFEKDDYPGWAYILSIILHLFVYSLMAHCLLDILKSVFGG